MAQGLLELLSLQQALMAQWLPQAPMAQGLLAREPERAPQGQPPPRQGRQERQARPVRDPAKTRNGRYNPCIPCRPLAKIRYGGNEMRGR